MTQNPASPPTEQDLLDQERARREKLARLLEAGINPYPPRVERTHTIAQALAAYDEGLLAEDEQLTLTGRMISRRVMGKLSFGHIEDGTGKIQIEFAAQALGIAVAEVDVEHGGELVAVFCRKAPGGEIHLVDKFVVHHADRAASRPLGC